ncbi:MAG: cellobiose phosphorylase, partial [Candidatus Omnitrophota bacterium]
MPQEKTMQKPLWKFIDNKATFISDCADKKITPTLRRGDNHKINTLYLPLCNESPIMSSVTPDLHGDLKTDFSSFLLEPASRIKLSDSKSSRNFWVYINPKKIWSITGVSKDCAAVQSDKFKLEAGLLWQKITRENKKIGLKSEITSFIPSTGEPVEIMFVNITNISAKKIEFTPTAAIPVYGRCANNLHDHRHVTSLLCRMQKNKSGIIVTPTLLFDESGHKKNVNSYFVYGTDTQGKGPEYIYPTQEEFSGDNSDLEAPNSVINNILPDKKFDFQGKEPMAGLRFKKTSLKPKETCSYIIIMGITKNAQEIDSIQNKFNSADKILISLITTKNHWLKKSCENSVLTGNNNYDNWFRWVSIQPNLRKIFGCSFLPDFDYGKGGRGWRDLWQDCLSLILSNPEEVKDLLINNFKGVRVDGSNATIIGQKKGEFIADRNNIPRVWMDHGIWPLITTLLYIHQTADLNILLEETIYFKDPQLSRGREKDSSWKPEHGNILKDKNKQEYKGTILEHILIQNLVQFFNVGPHNHIRLEGADWNDGLDMAEQFGESVAFSAMYAQNLYTICEILQKLNLQNISLLKELAILLDSLNSSALDYNNIEQKQKNLENYFQCVKFAVHGEKISLSTNEIIKDLKKKADWISNHIRQEEWLKEGFFNGYYDNDKQKVEGLINNTLRMTLTGQVFPVMSGIAKPEQINTLFQNAKKYLQDKSIGGFRLNTDFKQEMLSLGRAFSFVYGEKENGSFFNHMSIMFAYALYKQGFVQEGFEVINSIFKMAANTEKSKIYPCLPEYFNGQGRGMYSYLTGSASWYILTIVTQMFGVRGNYGDLIIEPKLTVAQFKKSPLPPFFKGGSRGDFLTKNTISLTTNFASRKIEVQFINPMKKDF